MNGKVAKRIRREIYGNKDPRERQYFGTVRTTKVGFLQQLATFFKKRNSKRIMGGITADGLRQAYQRLKKQYKEVHRG